MLLGCANVYGADRNNTNQFYCAQKAYDLLLKLGKDIAYAYVDGTTLHFFPTSEAAKKIIMKSLKFMTKKEKENLAMNTHAHDLVVAIA